MVVYIIYVCLLILLVGECEFVKYYINEANDLILLELVKELQIHYVILMTKKKEAPNNIKIAKTFSMRFIPTRLENHDESENLIVQERTPNVTTALVFKQPALHVTAILDKLKETDKIHMASKFTWIIFLDTCPTEENSKLYNVPYNCQFVIVCPRNSNTLQLLEIFKLKNVTTVIDFGNRTEKSGLMISKTYFYHRRMNLKNTEFLLQSNFPDDVCETERACIMYEYLLYIAAKLNFTYRMLPGKLDLDKLDELKEADFYHDIIIFHADFDPEVERMIAPFFSNFIDWYIKYPTVNEDGDYLRPFHVNVWITISFTIIMGSSTIIVFSCLSLKFGCKDQSFSYIDRAFMAFDYFVNQEGTKNTPFKILAYMLRFTAIFTMAVYSARIISFLALQIPNVPFTNLEEFLRNGEYAIAKTPGNFSGFYLEDRSNPSIQLANKKFSRILKEEEVPDAICNDKVAMLTVDFRFRQFKKKCRLLKVEQPLDIMLSSLLLPKNTSFTKICNHLLIPFYTAGILQRLRRNSDHQKTDVPVKTLHPVGIHQVDQIFYIIPTGIALGAVLLICELIFKNFKDKNKKITFKSR